MISNPIIPDVKSCVGTMGTVDCRGVFPGWEGLSWREGMQARTCGRFGRCCFFGKHVLVGALCLYDSGGHMVNALKSPARVAERGRRVCTHPRARESLCAFLRFSLCVETMARAVCRGVLQGWEELGT